MSAMVKFKSSNRRQYEIAVGRYLWELYVRGVLRPVDSYDTKNVRAALSKCVENVLSGERKGVTEGMMKVWRQAALEGKLVGGSDGSGTKAQGAGRFACDEILYQLIGQEFELLVGRGT